MAAEGSETLITFALLARAAELRGLKRAERLFPEGAARDRSSIRFEDRASVEALFAAWELSLKELRQPSLPVEASDIPRSDFRSPLSFLCAACSTLDEALDAFLRYGHVVTDAYSWSREVSTRGDVTMVLNGLSSLRLGARAHAEFCVGGLVREAGLALGAPWRPRRVTFVHPRPSDDTAHRQLLGRITWSAPRTSVVFAASDRARPLAFALPGLVDVLHSVNASLLAARPAKLSAATDVREAIRRELVRRRRITVAAVSRELGCSTRTLQRALQREETSLLRLASDVRYEIARDLLRAAPRPPLKAVAAQLGFASSQSFARAYRRWTSARPATAGLPHELHEDVAFLGWKAGGRCLP